VNAPNDPVVADVPPVMVVETAVDVPTMMGEAGEKVGVVADGVRFAMVTVFELAPSWPVVKPKVAAKATADPTTPAAATVATIAARRDLGFRRIMM